jgi:CheY-like chemotaxis protein
MKTHHFARLTVLVADPAPHMTTLVTSMLHAIGLRDIAAASTLPETLNELRSRRFDLLMIDDRAEGWDGLDLVRSLRRAEDAPNRHAPVLLMIRAPDAARIKAARDAGVTEILRKPFAAHDIETRLNAMLMAPRDFIAAGTYAGPDRRRRRDPYSGENRRRIH